MDDARADAFTLYYATLFDPLVPGTAGVHCVLRAVLDGWPCKPPHRHRLVIDYVGRRQHTAARVARGR